MYSPLQLEYAATDAWGHLKLQQLCDESQAITRDADDASECSETEMDADDDSIRMSVADADVGGDDDGGASETDYCVVPLSTRHVTTAHTISARLGPEA